MCSDDWVISDAARSVWAKSADFEGSAPTAWLPLWTHLSDAGAVAFRLWEDWLPTSTRRLVSSQFGRHGEDAARSLLAFVAATHDLGKATPAFATQVPDLAFLMREAGLPFTTMVSDHRHGRLPHGLAGAVLLERWLTDTHGWDRRSADVITTIVGGHHGVPPTHQMMNEARLRSEMLGEGPWKGVQDELIEHAALATGAAAHLGAWQPVDLSQPVQVVLSALVIVADWIASSSDLFPLLPVGHQPPADTTTRLDNAWSLLRFPSPWHAGPATGDVAELMSSRFDLPPGAEPRPVQLAAVDAARQMPLPGVMVIEAPMGEGKTEAALLAAEILAGRTGAGGVFVALPTQATTDAHVRPRAALAGPRPRCGALRRRRRRAP